MPVDAPAALDHALRSAGLREAATDGAYVVDGVSPRWIGVPDSQASLAAMLAICDRERVAVLPWGAGNHIGLGNIPERYDAALSMLNLSRVIDYEPADMTVTIEAGMKMAALQALLAQNGQFLPIDAPPDATVGGVLATAVSGPSQHRYGLPRDWLIGCTLVLAGGSIVKGGGRVVKNVAGYDLPRLTVGSLGTLGVIAEATFKVAPIPPSHAAATITFSSAQHGIAAIFAADARGLALRSAALLTDHHASATAMFELAGPPRAVDRSLRELEEIAGSRPMEIDKDDVSGWSSKGVTRNEAELQISLPPSRISPYVEYLEGEHGHAGSDTWSMETLPATGRIHFRVSHGEADSLARFIQRAREQARTMRGALTVTAAPIEIKQRVDVWDDPGPSIRIMRRLKEEFDPNGVISPGRYVGGI
jgi:glycolate oxidase FAD binding subunit